MGREVSAVGSDGAVWSVGLGVVWGCVAVILLHAGVQPFRVPI